MSKSIRRNYFYNAAYNVLTVLTPLITAPYISRVLGADGIGTASFAASVAEYFVIFADMGTGSYGQREISYCRDDPDKRSAVFWETFFLRAINTVIALALYFLFALSFMESYRDIFLIYSLNITCLVFTVGWFFAGLEEFGKIVLRNLIIRIAGIVFIFLFVKTKSDLPLYVLGLILFNLAGAVAMCAYLPAYIKRPDFSNIHPFRNIKTVLSFFLPTVAVQVYTLLDKSMLGFFTENGFENGYYEQSMKISRAVLPLIISLGGVMIPRIGYLFGRNDRETINFYMYRSYNFVWFLSVPLCFGLMGISDNFVPWFFGPGYEKVAGLLKISSLLLIVIGFNHATGSQYLIPTGRQNLYTRAVIIGAAVNFLMNIVMIRLFKSYGAMMASVAAEGLIAVVELHMIRRELSIMRILSSGRNYIMAGIIMLAALLFMGGKLSPSAIHTFTMIFTGAGIYFAVLFALRDKFFTEYSASVLGYIKGKFIR
ncbi:MAG: flippase [Synergistaceae bacterium]|nr:flippase [Synergistaceae bacterium]